ncbi:MAG TPA: dihydropteroate synthase [Hyphomicrobiaceae bacterium]|nr:dihydropteroate synthase [Hyphomicrobiaceae bacterium]
MAEIYVRPVGRVSPAPKRAIGHPERVVRIAGRQDLAFSAFEAIERHGDGWVDRRQISLDDTTALLQSSRSSTDRLKTLLERISAPRGDVAGLPLDRPRIMGIVNVTPDSFSDGGRHFSPKAAIEHALKLEAEGADILDIGGESTRPGSDAVPIDVELKRVVPVLQGLAGKVRARLSVDTRKAEVMREAARAGAHILNDVSALSHDPVSLRAAADTGLSVVLMHAQGGPKSMQANPRYADVVLDVFAALEERVEACVRAGIPRQKLIADPGIGFGKTLEHNLQLLASLTLFHALGTGLLVGASRKSFIGALTGAVDPDERLPGSLAAACMAAGAGAQIIRVHDVAATRQALTTWEAMSAGQAP